MKIYKFVQVSATVAVFASALLAQPASAQVQIYSSGHGDIGVGYDAGEFDPHWHLGSGATVDGSPLAVEEEFAPGDINARASATRTSPIGLSGAIGVADGTAIYAMGSATYQPNLGFAVEELAPGDWSGNITITLTSWTVPTGAGFSLYTTNLSGTTVVDILFSTVDEVSTYASNSFTMVPGSHSHFQWGFTDVGTYTFDFTWSGDNVNDGTISTPGSFSVQVIPEPSTVAMLGLGLLGAIALFRRRMRP